MTEPGQILNSEIRCEGGDAGFRRATREAARKVMVVTYGSAGRLDIPGLREGFRLAAVRRFEHGQFPIEVREYARR